MAMQMKNYLKLDRYIAAGFCIGILVFISIYSATVTGLGPIDDHQFIRTIFVGKPFDAYIMPELGRFFPLTAQEYALSAKLFMPEPTLFHAISGIKVFLCGLLLLLCLWQIGVGATSVIVLWSVVMLSIGFSNSSIRLQVGELNVISLTILFIWSALAINNTGQQIVKWHSVVAVTGVMALVLTFFYKEVAFSLALAFGVAEIFRFRREMKAHIPSRIWVVLILGVVYVIFYGIWRMLYTTKAYSTFHSTDILNVISLFVANDPVIVCVAFPLMVFRVIFIINGTSQHTIYDSFLAASSTYLFCFLALGIYQTYYLLPAYGFAVCGIAGILSIQGNSKINNALIGICCLLGFNNLPVAVADAQYQKNIANNHYKFVQTLSIWLQNKPGFTSGESNIVLAGVSSGSGAEILISLKTFLWSLGGTRSSFDVKASEPTDNPPITESLGLPPDGYIGKPGDILVFNPYSRISRPPSSDFLNRAQIFRSSNEWALPRWSAWQWLKDCTVSSPDCTSKISSNMLYSGYYAVWVPILGY